MPTSQNGWTVLDTAPPVHVVPGTDVKLRLRSGDAGYLICRFASWFHRNIERLDMPVQEFPGRDDWGWAKRNVRGSTTQISNHGSGTAGDLNATQHPRGVKGTFTSGEKAEVHAHLKEYKDPETGKIVLRWGEDYAGTVDGMHIEINADAAAVKRVADRLREEEDMAAPTAQENAAATVKLLFGTPIKEMAYVKALFKDADGNATLGELLNWGAGAAQGALGGTNEANRELDELRTKVDALGTKLDAVLEKLTPARDWPV